MQRVCQIQLTSSILGVKQPLYFGKFMIWYLKLKHSFCILAYSFVIVNVHCANLWPQLPWIQNESITNIIWIYIKGSPVRYQFLRFLNFVLFWKEYMVYLIYSWHKGVLWIFLLLSVCLFGVHTTFPFNHFRISYMNLKKNTIKVVSIKQSMPLPADNFL